MTGLSLAQEVKLAYPDAEITFFATSKHFEEKCISEKGFSLKKLRYTVGSQRTLWQKFRFLAGIILDTVYSCVVITREKPDVIVGLGGYSSAPPIIAATALFFPFVLIDQNVVPGKVNRIFSRWAKEVYCHFEQSIKWFPKAKSVQPTGNPVRKEILDLKMEMGSQSLGLSANKNTILILGGSQGARAINETMINCLVSFQKYSNTLQIIHCAGELDYEEVKAVYKQYKIDAYVCPFMSNIELAYGMADIVVARAGAGTITELTAIGLPSILVPYPFAADNHQYYNALEVEKGGAGVLVAQDDFTPRLAVKLITKILSDKEKHENMRMKSRAMGKPSAAKDILERVENLLSKATAYKDVKQIKFPAYQNK